MTSTVKYWAPRTVEPNLVSLLAVKVPGSQEMTPQLHRILMDKKVEELFGKETEQGARADLQMSEEHLPELFAISKREPPKNWPTAVMFSDQMSERMHRINWSLETSGESLPQDEIKEMLEEQTLQSLLEAL